MRTKMLLTAVAAAAFLSDATLGNPATAMTFAKPSTLGVVTADTSVVQNVRYYRYHRHYYGYYRPYYGLYGYYPYRWHRRWWW